MFVAKHAFGAAANERVSKVRAGSRHPMNAVHRISFAIALSFACLPALAQDDPFAADAGKPAAPADAPAAETKKPADIIRKVPDPVAPARELLPYQKKDLKNRLVKEIQMHLDARETEQAQAKLDELLDVQWPDSELRDFRRRYSRFLNVEIDQRVLETRRRRPTGAVALTEAVRRMLDINRIDEAQRYMAKLAAIKLTPEDRSDIYKLVGESFLRALIRDQKLGAPGAAFANQMLDAATSKSTGNSAVVQSLRSTRLNTPADQLDAIDKLIRYGAITDAQEIAEQLAKREMTADEMASLHRQVGSAPFLMLIREKRLGEAPAAFAQKVLETSKLHASNPDRLAEAVKKLQEGDVAAKRAASAELARGGESAAAALIKAASTEADTTWFEKVLVQLGANAVPPLVAARQSEIPAIRELAARALAKIPGADHRVYLLRSLFDPEVSPATQKLLQAEFQAAKLSLPSREIALERLRIEWDRAYDALRPGVVELDMPTFNWGWTSATKQLTYQSMTEGQSRRWKLAQIASDMLTVAPLDVETQRLAAVSLAEAAVADAPGYELSQSDTWAAKALAELPLTAIEQGLAEAGRRQRIYALLGLLQVIGKSGNENLLVPTAGEQRIVTKLLAHPHPRVRAKAVETVLKLTPIGVFAGSSQVIEALRGLAILRERPSVIVLDPMPSRAKNAVMMLRQAGWEAEPFYDEQELTRRVATLPEPRIVLVSEETTNVGEVLQRLRREPRFALAPVGVMALVDNLPGVTALDLVQSKKRATIVGGMGVMTETMLPVGLQEAIENPKKSKEWLHLDQKTRVVPYALSEEVLAKVILQLSHLQSDAPLTPEDQLDLAVESVRTMAFIASSPNLAKIFDLAGLESEAIAALNSDLLAAEVAPVVGFLGGAKCQEELVNLANQDQREVAQRQAAADAFKAAVEKRGLLLTQGAIAAQYDRYNQNRNADPAVRKVLGSVLDAIEIPWKKRQAVSAAETR